jgi:ketosteroid isomerase-like protein
LSLTGPLSRAPDNVWAMSQANVDIIRAGFDGWNAGEGLDVLLSRFHPQLVYHPHADEPDPSPHIGRDAYERLTRGFVDSFSKVTFEVLELIDAGDHVIVPTVVHGRIRDSGAEVSDTYVFVYKLRDGLTVEAWEYRTKEEALAAVGRSE